MSRKFALLLPVLLCLNSCAAIFLKKEYPLRVSSSNPAVRAEINDSVYSLPAMVMVQRSKQNLMVKVLRGPSARLIEVEPCLNPTYLYVNAATLFPALVPVGYLADLTTPKRFYYGDELVLNDTAQVYRPSLVIPYKTAAHNYFKKDFETRKGQVNLFVSVPYANLFYMQPRHEAVKRGGGFFGLSVGAEYYYKNRKFVKLTISGSIDFAAPILVPIENFGVYENLHSSNINLTDNFKSRRNTLGYGLNYAIYRWDLHNSSYKFPSNTPAPRTRNTQAAGLLLSAYHQFSKPFFAGIVYSPSVYTTFPSSGFQYQHTISLDIMYKFGL